MEANDYLKAMQAMDELDRLVTSVYPDKFKLVCKKHGIDEYEAMNMYSYLQKMHKGQSWLVRYKPLEYLERVLTLAKEAYASYMNNGDVMLCYVNKPEFWSLDRRNCRLYICESGSYHRLLYTPNKGYVRHGEPDVDEDFTLDIGEESFSSYVMTLNQSWYKLGNVHADIGFLKEKE